MGLFDAVTCELSFANSPTCRVFQTKSLGSCMGNYTITAQGRLIHHRGGYEAKAEKASPDNDVDIEFHGDIRLFATDDTGDPVDLVARFTRGTLEWVLPFESLSEAHQSWLTDG